MSPRTACIDFDGTIHDDQHPVAGKKMGPPMLGARLGMQQLKALGLRVVVYTARATSPESTAVVADWLKHYQIPYDDITSVKPPAVVYLDNRAIHFTTWATAIPAIRTAIR